MLKTVIVGFDGKVRFVDSADPKSEIMVYDQVYCDIYDDQSIHTNLRHSRPFTKYCGDFKIVAPTLVLFDEIGAGTD